MKNLKKITITLNFLLLGWFFLDMIGISLKENNLVTQSYKEDGIYFIVFLNALILFLKYEKYGKFILTLWLSIWLLAQLFSHWYFTIFGPWEGLNNYFEGTIKLIPSGIVYFPDLYHIILHLLIVVSLFFTVKYSFKKHVKH